MNDDWDLSGDLSEELYEDFYEDEDNFDPDYHDLFDQIRQPMIDSLFLKGKPDYRLLYCLKRSPESLQDVIAEEYGMELGRGKQRKRQLEVLADMILGEMVKRIPMMRYEELIPFMNQAFGHGTIDDGEGFALQKKGWIYYYVDSTEQFTIPVVPAEIVKRLVEVTQEDGFKERKNCYEMYRYCIAACLNMYGVFDINHLLSVMKEHSKTADHGEEWLNVKFLEEAGEKLENILAEIQEEMGCFETDEDLLYDPDLGEDEDYIRLYEAVKGRPYYKPSVDDIMLFRDSLIDMNLKEYRELKRYLAGKCSRNMALEWLLDELSIEAVEELGGVFSVAEAVERYGVAFSSVEDVKNFEGLFRSFENQVRKWHNRGFTNAELEARGEEGSHAEIDWDFNKIIKEEKPDPDGPCPCGSGKKYRQCCGRVKR